MSASPPNDPEVWLPAKLSWTNFTDLTAEESSLVLDWRNHRDVRKWMRNDKPISQSDHQHFLQSLQSTTAKQYYLIRYENEAIGVADFYNISSEQKSAYYGYYLNPEKLGSSFGLLMEFWVAEMTLVKMNLLQLVAETRPNNLAANQLHDHFAFVVKELNSDGLQEAVLTQKTWIKQRLIIRTLINRFFS